MHQAPNLNQEIRDTAQQLRQVLTRFDPNDELIRGLKILADAQTALADGDGGEAIERWREDYQQKRSQGKIA